MTDIYILVAQNNHLIEKALLSTYRVRTGLEKYLTLEGFPEKSLKIK